jgi:hypothetical protein
MIHGYGMSGIVRVSILGRSLAWGMLGQSTMVVE